MNPLNNRLSRSWTDEELDACVAIPAQQVKFISADPFERSMQIDAELERMYLPDSQDRHLLRRLWGIARVDCFRIFGSTTLYLAGINSHMPWGSEPKNAICIIGLGGVGKSAVKNAFFRLCQGVDRAEDFPGYTNVPLNVAWPVSAQDGFGLGALLGRYVAIAAVGSNATEEVAKPLKGMTNPTITRLARKRSWLQGVCILLLDELQFASLGKASAKAGSILLSLFRVGPRVIFCCNFDMIGRLIGQAQQVHDRVAMEFFLMEPFAEGDPSWIAHLEAVKSVSPGDFSFDATRDAKKIHGWTFGIRRFVRDLMVFAFRMAKEKSNRKQVGLDELERAYKSPAYMVHRMDVEDMIRQKNGQALKRVDLTCPFFACDSKDSEVQEEDEVLTRGIDNQLLIANLQPTEVAAKAALEAEVDATFPLRKPKIRLPAASMDDLKKGAALLGCLTKRRG